MTRLAGLSCPFTRSLAASLGVLVCASSIGAQAEYDRALRRAQSALRSHNDVVALKALDELLALRPDDIDLKMLRLGVQVRMGEDDDVLSAIGGMLEGAKDERVALETLRRSVERLVEDDSAGSDRSAQVARDLLEVVRHARSRGRAPRMVPLLLLTRRLTPEDWRVSLGLGEAFGVASPVFDSMLAHAFFDEFLATATPTTAKPESGTDARRSALAEFVGATSAEDEWLDGLRQTVLGHLEQLRVGKPIRIWVDRDAGLDDVMEEIVVARATGRQRDLLKLGTKLRDKNPNDPIAHYVIGEAASSYGPAFSRTKAKRAFERFLELTSKDTFASKTKPGTSVTEAAATRDSFAKLLDMIRGEKANDATQGLRMEVRLHLRALTDGHKLMLAPDRRSLARRVGQLEKDARKWKAELREGEADLDYAVKKKAYWESELARVRRQKPRRGRFIGPDPQKLADNVATCDRKRKRAESEIKRSSEKLEEIDEELVPMRARLNRYAQ